MFTLKVFLSVVDCFKTWICFAIGSNYLFCCCELAQGFLEVRNNFCNEKNNFIFFRRNLKKSDHGFSSAELSIFACSGNLLEILRILNHSYFPCWWSPGFACRIIILNSKKKKIPSSSTTTFVFIKRTSVRQETDKWVFILIDIAADHFFSFAKVLLNFRVCFPSVRRLKCFYQKGELFLCALHHRSFWFPFGQSFITKLFLLKLKGASFIMKT